MIIIREQENLNEARSNAVIQVAYDKSKGKLKATVEVDCNAAVATISVLTKQRYNINWVTSGHVAASIKKYLDEVNWISLNDDNELAQMITKNTL